MHMLEDRYSIISFHTKTLLMKILKIVGITLLVLVAFYLILCALGPKRVDANASVTVNAPVRLLYNSVADLETWENWSVWNIRDTAMKVTYGDTTVGKGGSYSWVDGQGETGNLKLIEAEQDKHLKSRIQFGNWPGYSFGDWTFEGMGDSSKLTWKMSSDTDIPFMARGPLYVMDLNGAIEKDFSEGLDNLKAYVEKKATPPYMYDGYEIKLVDIPERKFAAHKETVSFDEMQPFFAKYFPSLMGAVIRSGVEPEGMPSALYYNWDEENNVSDMAAAIGVKGDVPLGSGDEMITLPAAKGAMIDYYGDYEGLGKPHMAIDAFIFDFDHDMGAPVIEEYITDPMAEPDTSKWLTRIYYRFND